jgi:hypothetical protein
MKGKWKMLYTDFKPASTSSGKLGPFVGDVFQDLSQGVNSKNRMIRGERQEGTIKNILKIPYPPIYGELAAKQIVRDANTWQIEFLYVSNKIFGLSLPTVNFPQEDGKKEIRLWKVFVLILF